ncbi:hypothetical protein BGW39_006525 [Mortierella sp. 14UC]|nr:hypothetical protein BGW39_006525 [Mortierella sp. 14UC]
MSVASTASADSTSSAEFDHPETKAPWMLAGPVDPSIKTFLRLRPWDETSSTSNEPYLGILNDTDVLMVPPQYSKQRSSSEYKFTRVFDESMTQSSVFETSCLPLLSPVLLENNYKGLIFSHGVTKSGKTHSLVGSPGQAGIIPRALEILFHSIARCSQESNTSTQYRPFRVHDVEINADEPGDNRAMKSIRALDRNLATWIQKLALEPVDMNADDLLSENQNTKNDQVVSLPEGMSYSIWMSCAEIYSEKIYDLLATPSRPPVRSTSSTDPKRPQLFLTTDNATHQKYVQELQQVKVTTLEEAMIVLRAGYRQRQLYSALTNKPSPKSHCIVTIKVLKTPQFGESALKDAAKGKTSISQISMVDLAGSGRTSSTTTGHASQGVKDLGDVDTSLVVLGHCLKVLRSNRTTNSTYQQEVPFRQSKLTQLFQGSLTADPNNSQVCLIVNVNPLQSKFDETVRTLEYAATPRESSRTRIVNIREHSKTSPSNAKRLSAIAASGSHQPLTVQISDDSLPEHIKDAAYLSQDRHEKIAMEIENGKKWELPNKVETSEAVVGDKKEFLSTGNDIAADVLGSARCESTDCIETISSMRKEFDRHREAYVTQDKAQVQEFEELNYRLVENVRKTEEQEERLRVQDDEIRELKQVLDMSQSNLITQDTLHISLSHEIKSLKDQLAENERRREEQEEKLRSQDEEIQKLKGVVAESEGNRNAQEAVQILHHELKCVTDQLAANVSKRAELEGRVQSQDERIVHLTQELSEADVKRTIQAAIHNSAVQSWETEIGRLGAELERTRIVRGEEESLAAKYRKLEEELVRHTQALSESLNANHDLLKVQRSKDEELSQLREALAASEGKNIAMAERFKWSDHNQSAISLAMELDVSENKRVALERELAMAKEAVIAWDSWFASAPTGKLARVSTQPSSLELTTIASSGRLAAKDPLVKTDSTDADFAHTRVLATIQNAGDQAADQAAQEEDFVEHIDQTMASQDDPQEIDDGIMEDHTEASVTAEQHPPPYIDLSVGAPSTDFKAVPLSSMSTVATKHDFFQIIEIETDSDDNYHSTIKQRRINARLEQTQQPVRSRSSSNGQTSPDPTYEKLDSKLPTKKRTSTRARSLPGHEKASTSPAPPRSHPVRITRSRYSLPNNSALSTRARTEALHFPIKKTRLSASGPSLIFEGSDIDFGEDQEGSEEDNNKDSTSPQMSMAPATLPQHPIESGAVTTGAQSGADSTESIGTVAAPELSFVPGTVSIQGSNKEALQDPPNDENDAKQPGATPVDHENDRQGKHSLNFYPADEARQELELEDDMHVDPLPDFEVEDDELPARPEREVEGDDVTTDPLDAGTKDEPAQDLGAEEEYVQDLGAEDEYAHFGAQDLGAQDEPAHDLDAEYRMLSDESGEDNLERRTSRPALIDDHVGTPVADLSPVRSLYPKLESMTPSPRRGVLSLLSPMKGMVATEKQTSPSLVSSDARLKEPKARSESPERSRSSPPPTFDDVFMSTEDPKPTLRPQVDDNLDSDDGKHLGQVGYMDSDEYDDDKAPNGGATSEYDSAQESLYSDEATEILLEESSEYKENDDPNVNWRGTELSLSAKAKGKMRATEPEESMMLKDKDNDEENNENNGSGSQKQETKMIVMKPKSKKRKLRQQQTVFAEEMNEHVDMYDQPVKIKAVPRKHRNKNKGRMF